MKKSEIIKFAEQHSFTYNPFKNKFEIVELFDFQEKLLNQFERNSYNIICQSRQVGVDLAAAIYIAYFALKNENKRILIGSHEIGAGINFLDKMEKILSQTENSIEKRNEKNIYLKNGSIISTQAASINFGGGYGIDLLFLNNMESIQNIQKTWNGLMATISARKGKVILCSTPRFKKGFFHNLWTNSSKNNFKRKLVLWKENPYLNNEWYIKMCNILDHTDSIATELDCKFIDLKKKKKSLISIRLETEKKEQIRKKMRQKNMNSITEYIMELINKDLSS